MGKVVIIGAAGRMGQALVRCLKHHPSLRLVGAIEHGECPLIGRDAGTVAGEGEYGVAISDDLPACAAEADVLIDFSLHTAVPAHVQVAAELGKGMVIGTTGLFPAEKAIVQDAVKRIPIVWAPNMSVGVNLLFAMVRKAAGILGPEYDVEVTEMHHRHKKDAPSGTALQLAEKVADGRRRELKDLAIYGREGQTGERPTGQIGIHALRGGDIIGDHTVMFAIDGERVEFSHRATSRDTFAMGALRAAAWVIKRPPQMYDMQDVLGL
jgi:4-hydroxy-tetrahydrodipicolinate reductase